MMARYNMLSLFQRQHVDQRSFGNLFRACHDEMVNISFIESLNGIMALVIAALRKTHVFSDRMIQSMLDLIMGHAIAYFSLKNNTLAITEG